MKGIPEDVLVSEIFLFVTLGAYTYYIHTMIKIRFKKKKKVIKNKILLGKKKTKCWALANLNLSLMVSKQ